MHVDNHFLFDGQHILEVYGRENVPLVPSFAPPALVWVVLVEHMLISHHGKPEFGAAVPPKFLEAIILSKLDELDATIYEVCETYTNVEVGEFSSRLWNFDNIALYNPGRADHPEPVAKLFDTED